jgi:hypothetical protein
MRCAYAAATSWPLLFAPGGAQVNSRRLADSICACCRTLPTRPLRTASALQCYTGDPARRTAGGGFDLAPHGALCTPHASAAACQMCTERLCRLAQVDWTGTTQTEGAWCAGNSDHAHFGPRCAPTFLSAHSPKTSTRSPADNAGAPGTLGANLDAVERSLLPTATVACAAAGTATRLGPGCAGACVGWSSVRLVAAFWGT